MSTLEKYAILRTLMNTPSLSPNPHRGRHVFWSILGGTALVWLVIFLGYTGYFLWEIKYGSAEDIAKTYSQFKTEKFTASSNSGTGPRVPDNGDWTPFIHPYNPLSGQPSNKVTIVAFIDPECPFSQENYPVFKGVIDAYGGAANIVYKFLPLTSIHPNALAASEAMACANDQGKFWPYYQELFETKKLAEKDLQNTALKIGLEPTVFNNCLASHKHRKNIEADVNEAIALGVRGTPTYFINNDVIEGGADRSVWDAAILRNLK